MLTIPGSSRNDPSSWGKTMGVIVVVCAAFGLTVSEAKTEIMCLRAKGMPESTAIEAAGQMYNQTNEFVYLGGNVHQNAEHTQRMVQLRQVHPRTVQGRDGKILIDTGCCAERVLLNIPVVLVCMCR